MREWHLLSRHAGTVFVGQIAVMAFGVTDTLVAARYSSEALAALSVGSATYISIFVALLGVLTAQLPIWSELRGAGHTLALGRSVRQSLYLALAITVVGMTLLLLPGPLLTWTQIPATLRGEVEGYLAILALALPAALLFRLYSTLNQSLGKPLLVTWIQIGSLGLKVPLSIWFVFGGMGLPPLGLAGCAWATLVVNWTMVAIPLWMLRTQDLYAPYRLWQRIEPPHWATIRGFARLGIPTGLSIMVEVTAFTLMALFIARQGTIAAASHQVASTLAALVYMMPLSLGIASSARVSYWLGAGHPERARAAMRLGLQMALGLALTCSLLLWLLHLPLARLFAGPNPPVVLLAATLLPWVALYHLFDAVQAVGVFILRSYGVATASLVIYSVLLWGLGLGGGYVIAYQGLAGLPPMPTPSAFWIAASVALGLTAVAVLTLLAWASKRPRPAH
jgi:MATE family multidrug resistance protein